MANAVMSLVATSSSRIKELSIKNGQLIFIQDLGRIAFDFNNTRVFYNQIVELESESDRLSLNNPTEGYYFVINSGCLWSYKDDWIQITEKPKDVIFIGVELPQLGQAEKGVLYINKAQKEITIYDSDLNEYVVISNYVDEISNEDIENLFKQPPPSPT